jgi:hypothetical protein
MKPMKKVFFRGFWPISIGPMEVQQFPVVEATIASASGDDATLAKSLIISLEDAAVNWYSRLPPKCLYSWQ